LAAQLERKPKGIAELVDFYFICLTWLPFTL
jgi:hypothetical protein